MHNVFMKRFFSILCLIFILNGFCFVNSSVFAQSNIVGNYAICLEHFECVDDEYKTKFLKCDIPLTFVSAIDKTQIQKNDKQLVRHLYFPARINRLNVSGDAVKIREMMYNNIDVAKSSGLVVLLFDMKELDSESVYYALIDTVTLLENMGIQFSLYTIKGWHKVF